MRKAFIAAALLAGLGAPAAAMDLSPNVAPNNPALGHWSGRWSLCRAHLEQQGYPYSYLRRSGRGGSRGILSACSRELWRKHHRMT
jgi:opacity protein-like surface antigen